MEKLFEAVAGIDAGSEVVELTTFMTEDTKIKKTISYDQFCDALLSGRGSAQSIKIGLFPREVLSVVWGEHDREIYLFIPTKIRFLGYRNRSSQEIQGFMVPYPNMILKIKWDELNRRACPTSAWCTNSTEQWPTADTLLYRFPFGNVADGGCICMGGNEVSLTGTETLAEVIAKCEELFFNTPYNGDYYSIGNKINSPMSLGDLLTSINGKAQFPDELLILDGKKVQDLRLN